MTKVKTTPKYLFTFFLCLLLGNLNLNAATCVSTGNGNWATNATWSCGHVPTCGDSVVVLAAHTVTISSQQDLRGCGSVLAIAVYGTIRFVTGNKLRLPCGSRFYIFTGGSLVPGGGGGSSNELEICNVTMWRAADGTYTGPGCFPTTLTACGAVLPVEVKIFEEVKCEASSVCLRWETASERNNDFFSLEKSTNGLDYFEVANIKSKGINGNSTSIKSYEVKDLRPDEGLIYYRLRQVDFDKTEWLSHVVLANHTKNLDVLFSIIPNPNYGDFIIKSSLFKSNKLIKVILKDMKGKVVHTEIFSLVQDQNNIKLELKKRYNLVTTCAVYIQNPMSTEQKY